jgi:hypothetical protein
MKNPSGSKSHERPSAHEASVLICPSCKVKIGLPPGLPRTIPIFCPVCRKSTAPKISQPPASRSQKEVGCLAGFFLELLGGVGGIALAMVFFGALYLAGYSLYASWPVCAFCIASGIGWQVARHQKNPFGKAARDVLAPISLGLIALCLTLILLNSSRDLLDQTWPSRIEAQLVHAELKLRESLDLGLPVFLIILLALLLVNHFVPRWRVVTKFLAARDLGSKMTLALLAITSFTLGSQAMVQSWAEEVHDNLEIRYRASLREGAKSNQIPRQLERRRKIQGS